MPDTTTGIAREHVEHYLADLTDRTAPATVAKHYRSLQQLFRWLVNDGEIPRSPIERMTPPAVPEQPVPVLDLDALRALLATCKGNTFENRRDEAIIRLLVDTGRRAGELIGLTVEDIDREQAVAYVIGKGGRGRAYPYGLRTAEALRRYLRPRPTPAGRPHCETVARQERPPHGLRCAPAPRAPLRPGRAPARSPAPVPPHVRAPMARRGWAGERPHAAGRLAFPGDGRPLRRIRCRRTRSGRAPPPRTRGRPVIPGER